MRKYQQIDVYIYQCEFRYDTCTFQKVNNKGSEQTGQMLRLFCVLFFANAEDRLSVFDVQTTKTCFLSLKPRCLCLKNDL